jgi:MarR family transcriptional regulator, protease production regulatory protein HPr
VSNLYSIQEAMIYSQKLAHLSKAMWKCVERDWQNWIKEYGLNINEHHILWISFHLEGATISDISKFGVMHVSTAFNFSKKLEEQGYIEFSKNELDKRNTYVTLTESGRNLLLKTLDTYNPEGHGLFSGTMKLRELYGKFPEFNEAMSIVRQVYGDEFMTFFDQLSHKIQNDFEEVDNKLVYKKEE